MSEEVVDGSVNVLDGVEGADDINANANPSTPTEGQWFDGLSEQEIGHIQNKGWETPADMYKSYAELEKFRGVPEDQLIKKPKEGESWDEVYSALGRPESAEDYVYNAPEGVEVSPIIEDIQKAAFEAGLSSAGFTKLTDAYNEAVAREQQAAAEAQELARQSQIQDARDKYGKDLDTVVATADATAMAMGWSQDVADTIRNAMGVVGMLDFMSKIADAVGEDTVNTSAIKSQYGKTREQMLAEKESIMEAIKGDPQRLASYNNGVGEDYLALRKLNESLFG